MTSSRVAAIAVPGAIALLGLATSVLAWIVLPWWCAVLVCAFVTVPVTAFGGILCACSI